MANIRKISNAKLEFYKGNWIIWKNHNKDYTLGSYYILNHDGTVDLVHESVVNVNHIEDIFNTKELKDG